MKNGKVINYSEDNEDITFESKPVACGQKIRNEMCLKSLEMVGAHLQWALARFENRDDPDHMDKDLIELYKNTHELVIKFLVKNSANEITREMHKEIINNLLDKADKEVKTLKGFKE